jgi:copper(I)-binding protein
MRSIVSYVLFSFLLGSGNWVFAASVAEQVDVADPYVRGVPPGQPNSASFMVLKNTTEEPHALVSAESPAAKVVELHTHTMVDGMMRMRQVEKIDLPAGKQVSLEPGGLHVMLIGLKQKLVPGENVPVTLIFDDGSRKNLSAPIRKMKMHMKSMDHSMH